jgi:lipoyl(octanoyl) transferase
MSLSVATAARPCRAEWLGRIGYRDALALQQAASRALKDSQFSGAMAEERLFLLEHPPVITLGRNAHGSDVLAGRERLEALGVSVETTDRGGQVTYHGPGQLVGYAIWRRRSSGPSRPTGLPRRVRKG